MSDIPTIRIGNDAIVPYVPDGDKDARGIVWMWEPPSKVADYFIGVDPTVGITGWNRALRTRDDYKTDNAVIEVFRSGGGAHPDVQVAEYAAPIDPEDLAPVVNALGKMYGGRNEESEALVIIEVYPGPGWMTQRELINRFGYTNIYVWRYEDTRNSRMSSKLGWYSSRASRRDLWLKGMRHINSKQVVIQSPWLVEEMTDCTPDNFLAMTARASYGAHDDRVVAMLLSLWAANEWSMYADPPEKATVEVGPDKDYQKSDISAAGMMDEWNDAFSRLIDE